MIYSPLNGKTDIKTIREEIKNKSLFRKTALQNIEERLKDKPEDLAKFKEGMYYSLKYTCGKKVTPNAMLKEAAIVHPAFAELNNEIAAYDERIGQLDRGLKAGIDAHQAQIKTIKQTLRTGNLNVTERNLLRLTIKDIRKTFAIRSKAAHKQADEERTEIRQTRRRLEKTRKKRMIQLKNTIRVRVRDDKTKLKAVARAERQLRKTLRKQGELREEFKEGVLKDLMTKYNAKVGDDFINMQDKMKEADEEKAEEKKKSLEKKAADKAIKMTERKLERETRKSEKVAEKEKAKIKANADKQTRKISDKALKDAIKDAKKADKIVERLQKIAEKQRNKTQKNKKDTKDK